MMNYPRDKTEQLRKQLRVLGCRHTFEILTCIHRYPKYLKIIASDTGIPYTTVQKRVSDLSEVGLVRIITEVDPTTKKATKVVRPTRFSIELTMHKLRDLVTPKTLLLSDNKRLIHVGKKREPRKNRFLRS